MKPDRVAIARAKVEMRVKHLDRCIFFANKAMEGMRKFRPDGGRLCEEYRPEFGDWQEVYGEVVKAENGFRRRKRVLIDALCRE